LIREIRAGNEIENHTYTHPNLRLKSVTETEEEIIRNQELIESYTLKRARYVATIQLFGLAMYKENPVAVVFVIAGFVLLIFLLMIKVYLRKKQPIDTLGIWNPTSYGSKGGNVSQPEHNYSGP